ncbi:MAG: hypothetical protein R3236_01790, partial [Phycisphaeraceae bacterium]|nr:hypothetical protein [Phycisphaeraceae bacterium]
MKSQAIVILTTFWALTLPACTALNLQDGYTGPQPLPAERKALFATPDPAGSLQPVRTLRQNDRYRVVRYRIESQVNLIEEHSVLIDWYRPKDPGPRPLILTLPILGGRNRVANHFAATFARAGFSAAIVHRQEKNKQTDDLETLN